MPAKLVAFLKIRDHRSDDTVCLVIGIQMLAPVNAGYLSVNHGLVRVQRRDDAHGFTIVDIRTILGLAYLIQQENRQ